MMIRSGRCTTVGVTDAWNIADFIDMLQCIGLGHELLGAEQSFHQLLLDSLRIIASAELW
jgi:hypothetical protein